jgi:E3 ubiquitin-protein ligase SHPRH
LDYKNAPFYTKVLETYLPGVDAEPRSAWSPQDFYDNVHVPPPEMEVPPHMLSNILECKLYPFQQRAVQWLLNREGAHFERGQLVAKPSVQSVGEELPPTFCRMNDARGQECFISHTQGVAVKDPWALLDYSPDIRGGILAEEMGLGKTVELIALVCLHRRANGTPNSSPGKLINSGATLIITPAHILQQWKNEIANHAPNLRVLHYTGLSSKTGKGKTAQDLLDYDIVLTTYNVLSREIYYADQPVERNFRQAQKHAPPRSPLVLINWWRVCLDEAQMIESGVSKAAKVARLIPRVNAWAVSGTPLKKNVDDLLGLLIFLGYEPYCSSRKLWNRVDKKTFAQIFGQIALRHTKHKIAHELRLPPQQRMVITMPFTVIEEENYQDLFRQMCDAVGLNSDGSPYSDDWDPNSDRVVDQMRKWLRRLRETCLHPQIGVENRRALGRSQGQGPLRTVGEVLEVMIEANETEFRAEERKFALAQIMRAHITANNKSNPKRSEEALSIYLDALEQANGFVSECRAELTAERAKAASNPEFVQAISSTEDSADETDADGKGAEKTGRIPNLQKQLRSALEVLHVCKFFVATSFFQIKENEALTVKDSPEFIALEENETQNYDEAKLIRQEVLQESHAKASAVMRKISNKNKATTTSPKKGFYQQPFAQMPDVLELYSEGGIENRKILDKLDGVSRKLDLQAVRIREWRSKVVDFLLKPLVDEDLEGQEKTGDEYEDSTKLQDELYVYTLGLRVAVADRQRLVTGQENLLIENELKNAFKRAKEDEGHAPELLLKIIGVRDTIKAKTDDDSVRRIVAEIRSLHTQLQWQSEGGSIRAQAELSIVDRQLEEIQSIAHTQTKVLADLEKEQELFRKAMNERLEFYRQLQAISDQVAPFREELDEQLDTLALGQATRKEELCSNKLAGLRTKRRFLRHLRTESTSQQEGRVCVICTDTFENGVLTVCGHQYCKECIQAWYGQHRTCPECRRHLKLVDFHEITYKPQELRAQEEANGSPSKSSSGGGVTSPASSTASIYSDISASTMDEIKAIDLNGSYGTKIDTIARHLLWLRKQDPGAKSIIFSQYSDFLTFLSGALKQFNIGHVSIRDNHGVEKFRKDPSKVCFLLDAKSDSSGLNLVNATHVFLCEPLINAAIELQAIARVHRIGQFRSTMVYMYLIEGTVEEAIYDISVNRRLAHMSTASSRAPSGRATPAPDTVKESVLDKANSLEMQQKPVGALLAKGKSAGEIVESDDLWNCLFKAGKKTGHDVSGVLSREVGRHLRAEAVAVRMSRSVERVGED